MYACRHKSLHAPVPHAQPATNLPPGMPDQVDPPGRPPTPIGYGWVGHLYTPCLVPSSSKRGLEQDERVVQGVKLPRSVTYPDYD